MVLCDRPLLKSAFASGVTAAVDAGKMGLLEEAHYVTWGVGVSVGEVVVETAESTDFTGTWAIIGTFTFTGVSPKCDYIRLEGPHKAIRHRISLPVEGGSVSTRLMGSE